MKHTSLKIGRAQDNDIVLSHDSISRHHLEVFIDEQGLVFVTDLNSSNGTYVNGNRIKGSALLNKGDILKLGADKPLQWHRWIEHIKDESVSGGLNQEFPPYSKTKQSTSVLVIVLSVLIAMSLVLITYFIYQNRHKKTKDSVTPRTQETVDSTQVTTSAPVNKEDEENPVIVPPVQEKKSTKRNSTIRYDYSCLSDPNDQQQTEVLNSGSDLNDLVVDAFGDPVELSDEVRYGNELHQDLITKYNFISGGAAYLSLQQILNNLVYHITNPRGFDYKIFLIQSDELNAFTVGGRIYVTTKMYDFCRTSDELACVIGHEINHNELGHIRNNIKMTSMPGAAIMMLITTSFNQKKETACDLHGIDLAIASGYEGCASVEVWKRMSQQIDNNSYDPLENLFRSHPYSYKRENCSKNHLIVNYQNSPCIP